MTEPLVFVPGMMCDARLFAPQIEALRGERPIQVLDITRRRSIEDLVEDALDALPSEPVAMAGLSMGGIVAMHLASRAPERLARLALFDTTPRADPPDRRALRDRQIADVASGRLKDVVVEELKPHYLARANQADLALRERLVAMALELGADAFLRQSEALRDRAAVGPALARFEGPLLVAHGIEDRLCPADRHDEIAALAPQARRAVIAAAGHIAPLENADAVTALLRVWLDAN